MLKLGIVGLPNVGKSTLFNALTSQAAPAENYPFCTVDPNIGTVEVPDERLDLLEKNVKPKKKVPAIVQFVDIAGLVKGASQGEGLGNQFLTHIRETDAIVHVVRCFEDPNVTHVIGGVDPVRDCETINIELALADLQSVEKRLDKAKKSARGGDKAVLAEVALLEKVFARLSDGKPARFPDLDEENAALLKSFGLITSKPVLYLANVAESDLPSGENAYVAKLREAVGGEAAAPRGTPPAARDSEGQADVIPVCSKIEAELAQLAPDERAAFLADLGLKEPGLNRLIRAGYRLLGLRTYFTAGEVEVRAWTIRAGAKAPEAAGVIHSDFEKHFIRAETCGWSDYERLGSVKAAKDQGLLRSEGKEYTVADGDILNILHSG